MKTNNRKISILLVEDDPNLSTILIDFLELINYSVTHHKDGERGLTAFMKDNYDLCIFDVMMPVKDGFTLAKEVRKLNKDVPIIFLTAKSLKEDRIKGFQTGCDDYIPKPFSTEELKLRIEAILRRCKLGDDPSMTDATEKFKLGNLTFDYADMQLSEGEYKQSLTRKEADLLRVLCVNKNKLVTRESALKSVWGTDDYFIGRSMDVFITKLRKYLKRDPSVSITNVHGIGFRLELGEN